MKDNREIIEAYIIENKSRLYRLAFSYTKNKEDALDAVQDSIVKALKEYKSLKNTEYIKSWYYNILTHSAIDIMRKNKKYTLTDETYPFEKEGKWDNYEDMDLKRALDSLGAEYRIIISLRFFEDMKIKEISDILQLNVNTVKTRLYKALELLKLEVSIKEVQ